MTLRLTLSAQGLVLRLNRLRPSQTNFTGESEIRSPRLQQRPKRPLLLPP